MIEKIISGGQTGADQGGLEAGKELGIETGGTAPQFFLTEQGPEPKLLKSYGLTEGGHDPSTYPKRTRRNVKDSDGTLLVGDISSPGSRLTYKYCEELNKPLIMNPGITYVFLRWIKTYNIKVLNVAGNRESKQPGIQAMTKLFLVMSLSTNPQGDYQLDT